MFFNGVLGAVQDLPGGAALREYGLALAGVRRFVDVINYPSSSFLPMVFPAAVLCAEREGSVEAAFSHFGRLAIDDFLASPMRRDFMPPAVHVGLLQRTVETLGGQRVRVAGWTTAPLDSTYEMAWD